MKEPCVSKDWGKRDYPVVYDFVAGIPAIDEGWDERFDTVGR